MGDVPIGGPDSLRRSMRGARPALRRWSPATFVFRARRFAVEIAA